MKKHEKIKENDEMTSVSAASVIKSRSRKRKRGISPLLIILPAIVIVAVSYFLYRMTQATVDYRLPRTAEQIYGGQTFEIKKGSIISVDRDGVATLNRENTSGVLTSIPIYYRGESSMITAHKFSYVDPRNRKELGVSLLTELTVTNGGNVELKRDNKTTQVQKGFLFDGDKTYIFLEAVQLSFNGYTFDLSPLSYVEADCRNFIMLYDRETGQTFMEAPNSAVTITSESGDYTVSLVGASYQYKEGTKHLLVNDASYLDSLI